MKAVNEIYQAGEWSEEVEAQTRFGVLGCALGTTGALVGGTVGGPLAGGVLCGIAAGDIPNSDREKAVTAAGIAGGIGGAIGGAIMGTYGAPIVGIATAFLVKEKLTGGSDSISPQTSDDED